MPNAENGLCNFHLVEKGMEQINPDIRGKDRIEVRNQKKTLKRWCYSWMRHGGVETMEEYNDSYSLLRIWLKEQSKLSDPDLSEDSLVYERFLTKTINYHIERVFKKKFYHEG